MIKGMTGYGTAQINLGKAKAVVELKSVNHRYLDTVFYLPVGFGRVEQKIRQILSKALYRGRVTVSIKIVEKPEANVVFHKTIAKKYLSYAKAMKKDFGLSGALTVADVLKLPGVMEARDVFVNADKQWTPMEKGIRKALSDMGKMRANEGRSLAKDMKEQLKSILAHIKKIEAKKKNILREKKRVLSEEEFLAYQRGVDINEELARLEHYIQEVKKVLTAHVSVGKKLDFIAQEMQREANTTGSKIQNKIITNSVIAIKSRIEKLREQAQNIE